MTNELIYYVLLAAYSISLIYKLCIANKLILTFKQSKNSPAFRSWLFLIVVIVSASFVDLSWLIKAGKDAIGFTLNYKIALFFIRIAWACMAIQYQALALFINSLWGKNYKTRIFDYVLSAGSLSIFLFFTGLAFYQFDCPSPQERPALEMLMQKVDSLYVILILLLLMIVSGVRMMRMHHLPRILRDQLKTFLWLFVVPYMISETMHIFPFDFSVTWISNNLVIVALTALLLTYMIYHCMRKVMGLRLFNAQAQVDLNISMVPTKDFQYTIEQLEALQNICEIKHIVHNYLGKAFAIPTEKIRFYIRTPDCADNEQAVMHEFSQDEATVEDFISKHPVLLKNKILVVDELEFSNFYEERQEYQLELALLYALNADIFVPIYQQKNMIGYFVIARHARKETASHTNGLYNYVEQDQMQMLAGVLSNAITLLQRNELSKLERENKELVRESKQQDQENKELHQEVKTLSNELFHKHHETAHYRESIQQFIFDGQQEREFGVVFYKNDQFRFGNVVAEELLAGLNLNRHAGHPIVKTLNQLVKQVISYRGVQTRFVTDDQGIKLIFSGIPNIEQSQAIVIVSRQEISDLVKRKLNVLRDLREWDYLMDLETTETGRLVDELIPGSGKALLNFKIDLLKMAFSKKALLLMAPDDDIMTIVDIIHTISLRGGTMQKLLLREPEKADNATSIKLFGVKTLLHEPPQEIPIFELFAKKSGTLFIENIQYLNKATQEMLAQFLKTGLYSGVKSEQRHVSLVRILCSAPANLKQLVDEGVFSENLFNQLSPTTLAMPSLLTLSEDEFRELTTDLSNQALKDGTFKQVLELGERDTKKMLAARPASIAELRKKIRVLLQAKAEQQDLGDQIVFDPAYDADPELAEAARLGVEVLKDAKLMALLLKKFNGNESSMAKFIGVNRSTVNRRLKEYGLTKDKPSSFSMKNGSDFIKDDVW
jgi:transcriptional regulator with GAF, ATPase, and Fis domain